MTLLVAIGCNREPARELGKHFTDWDLKGACQSGPVDPWGKDLDGTEVSPCDFKGDLLWVHYTAPFCTSCGTQFAAYLQAQKELNDKLFFVTVVTSGAALSDPTPGDVKQLRTKYRIPNDEIVIGKDSWGRTVPQHALMSRDGTTLFRHEGVLTADQIKNAIVAALENRGI